jgi:hypothetical protein
MIKELNKIEKRRYKRFKTVHYKLHKKDLLILRVHNTSIGLGFEVECKTCHRIQDITDYNCW